MSIQENLYSNRKKLKELTSKFRNIFNLNLSDFLGNPIQLLFGFDIVKFNEKIQVPEGVSLREFLLDKYGEEAVNLISELIN